VSLPGPIARRRRASSNARRDASLSSMQHTMWRNGAGTASIICARARRSVREKPHRQWERPLIRPPGVDGTILNVSLPTPGPAGGAQTAPSSLLLRDGRSVEVRHASAGDVDRVTAFFAGLTSCDLIARFGHAREGPDRADTAQVLAAPERGGIVLVAVAGGEAERVVALAQYEREPGASEGELALIVATQWQAAGIGTALIERLLTLAAAAGMDALWASVRSDNARMLEAFRTLGAPRERKGLGATTLVRISTGPDDRLDDASAHRFEEATSHTLLPLMRPRVIVVVGASRDPSSPGGAVFRSIVENGFAGHVYPVNHAAAEVEGCRAYASLALVPETPDLVVVAVPADGVLAVAREAAVTGARALVVLSAGFADDGPIGAALEAELQHITRLTGMRMLGPNCLGIAVTVGKRAYNATFGPSMPRPGVIALAAQSGGIAIGALAFCAARGLGLSSFVSLGNRADVSSNDLLAWWHQDAATRVVLLYLEGLGNARRLAHLGRIVTAHKPVVALAAGKGSAGRRAVTSHTAALAAGVEASSAVLELAGIVEVATAEELFEAGALMADQPLPAGPRVAILSNAGGPAILAADACEAAGLKVAAFPDELQAFLCTAGPMVAATANPVDLGAGADGETFARAGSAILSAGVVDAVVAIHTPTRGADLDGVAAAIQGLSGRGVTIAACRFGDRPFSGEVESPVVWFDFPESAVRALGNGWRATCFARRPVDPAVPLLDTDRAAARVAIEESRPGEWLGHSQVERLLTAYGIPSIGGVVVTSPERAAEAQRSVGAPVVVKLISDTITHKSDVGGVILGIDTAERAAEAYREIASRVAAIGRADEMQGALIQRLAPEGVELIVGATVDPVVGPLVLGGIGGTQAEVLADRRVALAPVGPEAARDLWDHLHGGALLDGYRGAPPFDRDALADLVVRVGRLIAEQTLVSDLDLNPVRALPGGGLVVLDARCRRADQASATR
jgi:acetate---CoA ligase (ADP-forming)